MATKIVTKNSSTASAVPTASDLVQGELAVNVADKRLFTEDNGGAIVELGTNPSTIDINAGTIDGTAVGASSASTGAFTTLTGTQFSSDATDVELKYSGSQKLATTSTGIDVTGTATMDGLVVNGAGSVVALSDNAVFNVNVSGGTSKTSTINQRAKSSNGSNADTSIVVTGSSGEAVSSWDFKLDTANGALTKAMSIDGSGDISFYEDTGTTAKLFWDASAESLGIGTSSPAFKLDVAGNARASYFALRSNESVPSESAFVYRPSSGVLGFGTGTAERMRIDSSGRVGIGTSSPSRKLTIQGGAGDTLPVRVIGGSGTTTGGIEFQDAATTADYKVQIGSIGDNLYLRAGGAERMRIDSSGQVGIGTSSPSQELHVVSSGESDIRLQGSGSANHLDIFHNASDFGLWGTGTQVFKLATNGSERMRIDSSGNVGIGTSSPLGSLHVKNTSDNATPTSVADSLLISHQSGSYTSGNYYGLLGWARANSNGTTLSAFIAPTMGDGGSYGDLTFGTGATATERLRIDSSGNVGIGTSSPSASLNIVGTDLSSQFRISNTESDATTKYGAIVGSHYTNSEEPITGMLLTSSSSATGGSVSIGGGISAANAVNAVKFYTAANNTTVIGTERARIDSSGNLLVGRTGASGLGKLNVEGGADFTGGNVYLCRDSGNLLVGTTSSQGKLTLRQDSTTASPLFIVNAAISGKFATFEGNGAVHGSITWSGSTTSYNTSSDQRLKENIADADDAGSKIDAIQVRKYDWKADGSHQDYGMVAQELVEVAPEAVSVPEDSEEMMGVDYSKLVPMLIKEIQSLRNRVAQLEE